MIRINKYDFPWQNGMTMQDAVTMALRDERLRNLNSGELMYMQNDKMVERYNLAKAAVQDGDNIIIFFLASGG